MSGEDAMLAITTRQKGSPPRPCGDDLYGPIPAYVESEPQSAHDPWDDATFGVCPFCGLDFRGATRPDSSLNAHIRAKSKHDAEHKPRRTIVS
jgi:hypothetical protein